MEHRAHLERMAKEKAEAKQNETKAKREAAVKAKAETAVAAPSREQPQRASTSKGIKRPGDDDAEATQQKPAAKRQKLAKGAKKAAAAEAEAAAAHAELLLALKLPVAAPAQGPAAGQQPKHQSKPAAAPAAASAAAATGRLSSTKGFLVPFFGTEAAAILERWAYHNGYGTLELLCAFTNNLTGQQAESIMSGISGLSDVIQIDVMSAIKLTSLQTSKHRHAHCAAVLVLARVADNSSTMQP